MEIRGERIITTVLTTLDISFTIVRWYLVSCLTASFTSCSFRSVYRG